MRCPEVGACGRGWIHLLPNISRQEVAARARQPLAVTELLHSPQSRRKASCKPLLQSRKTPLTLCTLIGALRCLQTNTTACTIPQFRCQALTSAMYHNGTTPRRTQSTNPRHSSADACRFHRQQGRSLPRSLWKARQRGKAVWYTRTAYGINTPFHIASSSVLRAPSRASSSRRVYAICRSISQRGQIRYLLAIECSR